MTKREIQVVELGTTYQIPIWEVIDGKGINQTGDNLTIQFVRGSKLKEEPVEKRSGVIHETVLSVLIQDLKYKNTIVPSRETSAAITKLQEGLHWLEERQYERNSRNVQGTYQK